jgi:hypothetical protein
MYMFTHGVAGCKKRCIVLYSTDFQKEPGYMANVFLKRYQFLGSRAKKKSNIL